MLLLALFHVASAATISTFPVDPAYTKAPFSGMESLVVDPVATAAALTPDTAPVGPDVESIASGVQAPDPGLVFTNPTSTWAWLAINGARIGSIGPFATARFDGVTPGRYRLELTLPNGFVRTFEVQTHVPAVDRPGTLAPVEAHLADDHIELSERVFFETDSPKVQAVSLPWLDAVAALMNAHPELQKVLVSGHTDSRGDAKYNLDLSSARAAAVRDYLVAHGVAASRLSAAGFGESRPLDTAETDAAYARNRRVEFVVIERAPEPPPAADPAPAKGKKRGK